MAIVDTLKISEMAEREQPTGLEYIPVQVGGSNLKIQVDNLPSSGGAASDFTDLGDTPTNYVGDSGKVLKVNATETGLEFGTAGTGTDPNAVHTNESGEIAGLPTKITPNNWDEFIIEDSENSNQKRKLSFADLKNSIGASATDEDAIHSSVSGEINAITQKGTPELLDEIVIEDSSDSNSKKKVTLADLAALISESSGGSGGGIIMLNDDIMFT